MGVLAAASVVGTAYGVYSGQRAADAQQDAMDEAKKNQAKQDAAADEAMNRANPKAPDTSALLSQIQQSAKGGPSGTMLTGPSGIDPKTLNLGKTSLLGS